MRKPVRVRQPVRTLDEPESGRIYTDQTGVRFRFIRFEGDSRAYVDLERDGEWVRGYIGRGIVEEATRAA